MKYAITFLTHMQKYKFPINIIRSDLDNLKDAQVHVSSNQLKFFFLGKFTKVFNTIFLVLRSQPLASNIYNQRESV